MPDYNLFGVKWDQPTVTWSMADANFTDRSLQFSSFLPAGFEADIQQAFARWSAVADINFQEVGDSDAANIRFGGQSLGKPDSSGTSIAGFTQFVASRVGADATYNLRMADIEFNLDEGWTSINGHETSVQNFSLYPVALHEIGHALGIAHYSDGPAIMNPVQSVDDLTQSDVDAIQALYGARPSSAGFSETIRDNGARLVDVLAADQILHSSASDIFDNHGQTGTRFVFDPGYARAIIRGFESSGEGHSVVDLPSSDFAGVADVLRHTRDMGGSVVIFDPASSATIRLAGVSKADLMEHKRQDFAFHG